MEGDVEANVAAACGAIEAADADLVAFPEMFLGGFRIRRLRPVTDEALSRIGAAARAAGAIVVIGGPEAVDGALANSAVVPGDLEGHTAAAGSACRSASTSSSPRWRGRSRCAAPRCW